MTTTTTERELWDKHYPSVFRFAFAGTGHWQSAEDIAQEVFSKALRRYSKGTVRNFQSYLRACGRNEIASYHRRQMSRQEVNIEPMQNLISDNARDPESSYEQALEDEKISGWITQLPPFERRLIALRFGRGLPHAEVAEILGLSPVNARIRIHRTLKKLRAMAMADER